LELDEINKYNRFIRISKFRVYFSVMFSSFKQYERQIGQSGYELVFMSEFFAKYRFFTVLQNYSAAVCSQDAHSFAI
jgi:hypothetical protein